MKNTKKILYWILIFSLLFSIPAFAHSGRTDSSGGHHDYNNVSGLGSYHYHCGGYPPHLHEDDICPYAYSSSGGTYASKLKEKEPVYTEYNSAGRKTGMYNKENMNAINSKPFCTKTEIKISFAFIAAYLIALFYRVRVQKELYVFPFIMSLVSLFIMLICIFIGEPWYIALTGISAIVNLFCEK